MEEKQFKYCSVCKKKLGWLSKTRAKKRDKSGKYPITQQQFCSTRCAMIGYQIILEMRDVKLRERDRVVKLLDSSLAMIARNRSETLKRYGSIDRIPTHELPLLYSGAYRLLENIKEKVEHGNEKKTNQFSDSQRY